MLFNSIEFLVFLPLVFIVYWALQNNYKFQNGLLLIASYAFYGWWDYRFLILIAISTISDFILGIAIKRNPQNKNTFLLLSILINIGILLFFKYFNFFIESTTELLSVIGLEPNPWSLKVILPVGISFYTFQTLSYTIDIYRDKITPTKNLLAFSAFVAFFPQLVAGPIERASNLLPQVLKKRKFDYRQAESGLKLILFGLFKKVAIADSLAPYVNEIFSDYSNYDGSILFLAVIYFSFQIYADFSGYSDIAIGTAKLFGIELMTNFNFPYFSRNIGEFWRRWHISLSTWFRDYIYIPMGGSKESKLRSIVNIFVVFLISGLWHGANWTFVFWGLYHALLFIPLFIFGSNRKYLDNKFSEGTLISRISELIKIFTTFLLVSIGWVFFRSPDLQSAFNYLGIMFSSIDFPSFNRYGIIYIFLIVSLDWLHRKNPREVFSFPQNLTLKIIHYVSLLAILSFILDKILYKGSGDEFIYFQF